MNTEGHIIRFLILTHLVLFMMVLGPSGFLNRIETSPTGSLLLFLLVVGAFLAYIIPLARDWWRALNQKPFLKVRLLIFFAGAALLNLLHNLGWLDRLVAHPAGLVCYWLYNIGLLLWLILGIAVPWWFDKRRTQRSGR